MPHVDTCSIEAPHPLASWKDVRMGTAAINEERCISLKDMHCELRYRSSPLIDGALTIDYRALVTTASPRMPSRTTSIRCVDAFGIGAHRTKRVKQRSNNAASLDKQRSAKAA